MKHRRWMILGASLALVVALTVAAVGTAFADNTGTPASGSTATTTKTTRAQKFLDRLASNLGITSDQLQNGLKTTEKQYVDDAVNSHRITAAKGDQLKQKIDASNGLPALRQFLDRHPLKRAYVERNVADQLGMTVKDLRAELKSGKTLSQIITEHGKTVDDVVNGIVAQAQTRLDQAVSNNTITKAREQQMLDNLRTRLTNAIDNQGKSQTSS